MIKTGIALTDSWHYSRMWRLQTCPSKVSLAISKALLGRTKAAATLGEWRQGEYIHGPLCTFKAHYETGDKKNTKKTQENGMTKSMETGGTPHLMCIAQMKKKDANQTWLSIFKRRTSSNGILHPNIWAQMLTKWSSTPSHSTVCTKTRLGPAELPGLHPCHFSLPIRPRGRFDFCASAQPETRHF